MEPLMAAAAEPTETLRVGRSGGYRLTVATQWESIKIGRSRARITRLNPPRLSSECGGGGR